jgi:hypothetical protein
MRFRGLLQIDEDSESSSPGEQRTGKKPHTRKEYRWHTAAKQTLSISKGRASYDCPPKTPAKKTAARKRDATVLLAPGTRDHSALDSVIAEWLVPLLVKEFLAEHWPGQESDLQNTTTGALGKGGATKVAFKNHAISAKFPHFRAKTARRVRQI